MECQHPPDMTSGPQDTGSTDVVPRLTETVVNSKGGGGVQKITPRGRGFFFYRKKGRTVLICCVHVLFA